jgi:DNA-binding LytR/AlgR family response regulator
MLRCIAIDDEPLALSLLTDNISKIPYLTLIASCNDAFEAMKVLQENPVDLIFIDIQMPGLTGLQFIESLSQKPMVILVTAYKQFALDSYSLDVVDYLVKPVPVERFIKACNKAKALYELQQIKKSPDSMAPGYFFIHADYSMIKVEFDNIRYIEGLRDYIKIHLNDSVKPIITRQSMTGIEKLLPSSKFLRIHKSFVVAIASISSVRKSSVFIKDIELPVSETYKDAVIKLTSSDSEGQ